MTIEELKDIEGSEHLMLQWGEDFRSWYFTKKPAKRQNIVLKYKNSPTYSFTICNYNYRFIMPPYIEFSKGIISYAEVERLFGVFRFPRDEKGEFVTPMSAMKSDGMLDLSEEEMKKMLNRKAPLLFNAYKIPQFGFEYINITDQVLKDVEQITDKEFAGLFKKECEGYIKKQAEKIKKKILAIPNFLLILSKTLEGSTKLESNNDEILFYE